MHFDAHTAVCLMKLFGVRADANGQLLLAGRRGRAVMERGLDFYRELCCALGSQAALETYRQSTKGSGSKWSDRMLDEVFAKLSSIPFNVHLLTHCDFLDFGSSRAILSSGTRLLQEDRGLSLLQTYLDINNELSQAATVQGTAGWVEGCRIGSSLSLGGNNVLVGVDVDVPLALAAGACLDVIAGHDHDGHRVWFVRCYGIDDAFKETIGSGALFCGHDIHTWLQTLEAKPDDVWEKDTAAKDRTLWNARLFPAVARHEDYRNWLWMFDPSDASAEQRRAWRATDRYSFQQILALADHEGFYQRRAGIWADRIRRSLGQMFRPTSGFSAGNWHLSCATATTRKNG